MSGFSSVSDRDSWSGPSPSFSDSPSFGGGLDAPDRGSDGWSGGAYGGGLSFGPGLDVAQPGRPSSSGFTPQQTPANVGSVPAPTAASSGVGGSAPPEKSRLDNFFDSLTPQNVLAGVVGTVLGGPLIGAAAFRGMDALAPRGTFSRGAEDEAGDAPGGFFGDMGFDMGSFWDSLGEVDHSYPEGDVGGAERRTEGSDALLESTRRPAAGLPDAPGTPKPVPEPEPEPEPAGPAPFDPLARPDLLYGPYFNPATGGFGRPGEAAPYADLVRRYGVTRAGI